MKEYKLLKLICLSFFVGLSQFVFATENMEMKKMDEMLSSIHLEKKQVEKIIERMVRNGRMTPDEGAKAKREIASIKDSDVEKVNNNSN